jgi:hypothetical protein
VTAPTAERAPTDRTEAATDRRRAATAARPAAMAAPGDTFLSKIVPQIMGSNDYKNNGVIFIVWDEGSGLLTASDGPIPFFAIGANVKKGFAGQVKYTHSSLLRSVQEIFGITPFIRDAANANDFADLFTSFP